MLSVPFYYALLLFCWVYSLLKGGAPERIGTTILVAGSLLSLLAVSGPTTSFGSVEIGVFLADVATLVAFLILALFADRYWPLWIAALQVLGTTGHAVKLADPDLMRRAYAVALVFWSYPMLAILALGTYRHQRRLARFGVDRSWSSFSGRSATPPGVGPTS